MGILDIGDVLVNLYVQMKKDAELQAWIRLFLSLILTDEIAFCGTAGPALVSGQSPAVAIGIGLSAVGACTFALCLHSPLTRALMLEVPKEVVEDYQEHPKTVEIASKQAEKK